MRVLHLLTSLAVATAGAGLLPSPSGATTAGVSEDVDLVPSESLTITEPGTVVDGLHVDGSIYIGADDVTVINSKVSYGGYHSIRVAPDVEGARIIDTTVECRYDDKTNGVVFGNYYAEGVALVGCRHGFMSSGSKPAVVVDSTVDGKPFSLGGEGRKAEAREPRGTPDYGSVGLPEGTELVRSGSLRITEPGTVVDGVHINGQIHILADDVTVIRSKVSYGGYHSIRVASDVANARIIDTTVECRIPDKTNGLVFGNYYAEGVALEGCRHNFMSSASKPAVVVDSTVDGVTFSLNVEGRESGVRPEPKPSPVPEPQPEPRPEPTGAYKEFPSVESTGVPAGVELEQTDGMTITQPGAVIEAKHILGPVRIEADNVTVRNSLIETGTNVHPVLIDRGVTGARIENVEIDNLKSTGVGIFFRGAGTVRRANIHSAEDGIRIEADNVTIEDSYVHSLHRVPGGHHDSLQIRRGDNITLRGSNFQAYLPKTDDPLNAAIQIGSLLGNDPISNLVVENNLFNGGNFTINGGAGGTVDSARYSGNQFGRDYRYGPVGNIDDASRWDDTNVWYDTGEPVR